MVCVSGGKDSHAMLELLIALSGTVRRSRSSGGRYPDQKQPGYPEEVLPAYSETLNIPFYILERDTCQRCAISDPRGQDNRRTVLAIASWHPLWVR